MNNEQTDWRGRLVTHLFRLIKLCRMHELENEATQQALENATNVLGEMLGKQAAFLDVVFAGNNIFVNGRPLRASRSTYTSILDLGELLEEAGYNEITIRAGIDRTDLEAMLRAYMRAFGAPNQETPPELEPTDRVRFRRVDPHKILDLEGADRSPREQVLQLYPAAVVTMRRFLEELRRGELRTLRFVKRISQRLVALSDDEAETLLAVTAVKKTRDEPAGTAVNAAILALLMARRITDRYRILHRTCFGALVSSVGRPRAAGLYDGAEPARVLPQLDREGRERLGPLNALLLLKNSRIRHPGLRRATVAYEAGWLTHKEDLGWPWGSKQRPAVESLIVEAARQFWELMALQPTMDERRTPAEVFDRMLEEAETKVEHAIVQLAMEVMAFYRAGDIVETTHGWRGVVVEPGESLPEFSRPVVRMVRDADGNSIEPRDVDLSEERHERGELGVVRRVLEAPDDDELQEVAQAVRGMHLDVREAPSKVARPSHREFLTGAGGRRSSGYDVSTSQLANRSSLEPPEQRAGLEPSSQTLQEETSRDGSEGEGLKVESSQPEVVMEFGPGSTKPTTHATESIPEQTEKRGDLGDAETPRSGAESLSPQESFAEAADDVVHIEESSVAEVEDSEAFDELEAVQPEELDTTRSVGSEQSRELLDGMMEEHSEEGTDTRDVSAESSREILREFIEQASAPDDSEVDEAPDDDPDDPD